MVTAEVIKQPRYFVLAGNYREYQNLIREYPEMKDGAFYVARYDVLMNRQISPPGSEDRPIVIETGTWEDLPFRHRQEIYQALQIMGFRSRDYRYL
jgi:hypothetical protein